MKPFTHKLIKAGNSVGLMIPVYIQKVMWGATPNQEVEIDIYTENGHQVMKVSWPIPLEERNQAIGENLKGEKDFREKLEN